MRTSSLFNDQDGDGVFDPGDVILTKIRITNAGTTDATGVSVTDTLNGVTLVPGSVQVTPIAFDDLMPSITGNTPITFTAAQLLGNDVDPDGAEINLTITGVSGATNGAIVNNGDGTFTFTPTTGFVGVASFQYTITDEQTLSSVTTGIVSFTVTDPVWYVNNATGSDVTGDGSYAKPFATLVPLSTGGSADALDNADDTIFVYNAGTYSTGIVLETGQKLFGDGHVFSVNGLNIGANGSNTTIGYVGVGVTLASNNTIMGVTLNGTGAAAVGIQDNGNVGTLIVDETSITGQGKAVDIDSGGTLNVDLDQLSSASSASEGIHLQGVTGTFSAASGHIQNSVGTAVLIGAAGGATPSSGGDVNFTYGGNITSPGGSIVEIQDRTGGTITFSGTITEGAIGNGQTGILIDGSAGTVNFNGQTFISAGAGTTGNGVALTNNSGTINFAPTGTGLDITTTAGSGLTFTGGGTLNITGAANSISTATGQIMNLSGGAMGTSGIAFSTLSSSGTVANTAINISNLDAAGAGTFSGGAVTIAGTSGSSSDGIFIGGGSNSTFGFASATINSTGDEGIEINGAGNGAVTFTTVAIGNATTGNGIEINGATNSVTISGGTINAGNNGDALNVTGGTGAVTVAANISKSTAGNVVEVSGHNTGTIAISGNVSTTGAVANGVNLFNNPGGNINFTGDVSLVTGANTGFNFTNTGGTGAAVTLSGGAIDITTTGGTGINATNSTIGAGSLTITGNDNVISATTGRAINIDGVTANVTLEKVAISGGGTTTGVWLKNTGGGGQFLVTGNGTTADSGGIIQNIDDGGINASLSGAPSTGTGYYFENVSNVSLSNIKITGAMGNFAIRGENVTNFTLRDSTIQPTAGSFFGDNESVDEGAIRFGTENNTGVSGIRGTALFEGNTIGGGYENNLSVFLYSNHSLTMTVQDSATNQAVFNVNSTTFGDDSLHVESGGTGSNLTLNVTNVTFNGARADQLQTLQIGDTTQTLNITGNQFLNTHTNIVSGGGGVWLLTGDTATSSNVVVNYTFSGNTIKGGQGDALRAIYTGNDATINGLILNNIIGTSNGVFEQNSNGGSTNGGAGIQVGHAKSAGSGNINYAVRIEGNTVSDIKNGFGAIALQANSNGTAGTSLLEATIKNNNVVDPGGDLLSGLYAIVGGQGVNDDSIMGLNLTGNTLRSGTATGDAAIYLDQIFTNTLAHYNIPGYPVNASNSHGESRSAGTASAALDDFWGTAASTAGGTGSNNLISGPFLSFSPHEVTAGNVFGITNAAFTLAVPAMAAPAPGIGWQDLAVSPVTPPPSDPAPDAGTPDTSDGGGTWAGGGTSGGGDGAGTGGGTGGSGDPGPAVVDDNVLTLAELNLLIEAAIQRWIDAGATPAQVEAMRAVQFGIVDMAGIFVGSSTHGVINIDNDAAGYGWFVDSTPGEDSEFDGSGTRLTADVGGAAAGRIDLLTVLMHELGHQIGLGDEYQTVEADDVMFGYMNVGERRLPAEGESAGAVPGSIGATAFALTPVSIGTLPSNKTVDVFFKATIDSQTDKFITHLNNDSTISGTNFSNVVANEMNTLDSLTLGSTVFNDANVNGLFDAGEGVVGVALQIYADTNDSGGWDGGDVLLGNTTTLAGGAYSFAGLAPGDYIVVVTAANFANGAALDDLLIVQGVAADPDNNVDNDNNGVAASGGAVASQTITLSYNGEPDGTPDIDGDADADTNNTLDFGFVANQPPVANDDSVSVAEDSGPNDLTSQLLSNDTDPENDTRTITGATQGSFGSTSVIAGVLTYTPNGNYNGSDTFTYTISDGQGHTDTATVNVTVTAVNDPVTGAAPATAAPNEDAVNFAITGMSIADVDATLAPAGVYDVTLSATNGTLTLTTTTGLTFGTGDGSGDTTMTFHGTLADINAALATASYTPNANYNGSAQIDLQVTDEFGAVVATGTGGSTSDTDSVAVTVNSVNDEPAGTNDSAAPTEGVTYTFLTTDFSDGFSDPIDNPDNNFAGVKITTLPATGTIKLNGTAILAGAEITKTQLDNGNLTFDAAAASGGTSPTFTFQVRDDGGVLNGGVDYDQSPNTFTLNIGVANAAPVVDLDADGAGTGFASAYTEGGAAAAVSDTDVLITDTDAGDDIVSATITITNAETGDKLNVGGLPAGVTLDGTSTDTVVKLVAAPGTSADDFEAAIEAVTFSSTSDDPTDHGTNLSRTITVTVNDGVSNSAAATATVAVTDVNDAPTGTSSTITAVEDSFRVLSAADLGFNDVDGILGSVTISAVTGGKLYFDSDGAGGSDPVEATPLPQAFTAQQLADGKVSFKANQDANGTGLGTITFRVTDDDAADAASTNVLTVDVTAANDSPVLTTGGPIAATEQTAVAILPAGSVADVDLDARNGGNGDYAGASFSVNRNPATNPTEDVFTIVVGPNFTRDGNDLKTTGGQIFATISVDGTAGLIVINFTSLEAPATSALVDEVIQSIRYTNTSNNPPASVDLAIGFDDGSPGGGQGAGATDLDVNLVTVNIGGVNDAPVNSLGGTIGTGEDAVDAWLSGMTISDPDANPATDDVRVTFQVDHGKLEILTNVVGGITAGDIVGGANDSNTITVQATLNEINATLAANNGLTYSPDNHYNGSDTLTVTTNDRGFTGTDPLLTGDGTSEETVSTRTITISAQPDAPVAQPDAVSTPENVIGTGSLFANNGSGPDSDPDAGDTLTISAVNGSGANVDTEITLASGAKLTVNADGSYSYNPNGKFTKLTDNTSGAVNTSTVGDTFQYTLTGGNTVTVTVTVNGVAGPGDWLMGDGTANTITGTPNPDFFFVTQGGDDDLSGLGDNDVFFFGPAMNSADQVDGGDGTDQIALQGNYSGGNALILGTDVLSVEILAILPGSDTRFGDPGTNFYDYNITTLDVNVASGAQMIVDANALRNGEDLTFNGAAEMDGSFFIYGGGGVDTLTGGAKGDVFLFGEGRWGASDTVNGGLGLDQLALRGSYTITFGATQIAGVENLALLSAFDTRYGPLGASYSYNLTMNDGNVASGQQMTVDAATLRSGETLSFTGTAENDGTFRVFGGQGDDVIVGGKGADILVGGLGQDTQTGGLGNDVFRYNSSADSTSAAVESILDFSIGDLVDLTRIDANVDLEGNQAFNFVGTAAFILNQAGSLRIQHSSGPIWLVQGDTNGDTVSDFEIFLVLSDADPITSGDFLL